ncbi:MAG: dienelactone hydrolase family protein [Pseudolabrys sp.]|nr:dienelactone hydrolase family protein [Pseudolabrys sp.]
MNGRSIDIPTPAGTMDAYAVHPDGGGPFPLVVLLMDIWGLREELFALARKVAAQGHYCVVPNLFYRAGKARYERLNADGKMVSFDTLPIEQQSAMQALGRGIDRAMVRTDIGALLDFMRGEPAAKAGPAGVVGFCLGGRIAFLAAQEFPERFHATASLHGVFLVTDAGDSPHKLASRMRGEVYCGHAEHDRFSAPELLAALAGAFDSAEATYHHRLHTSAQHGYSLPDRDIHDAAAAEEDWREIFALLKRQLSSSAPGCASAGNQ